MNHDRHPHPSLPARPPPSTYSAPPVRNNNQGARGGYTNAPTAFSGFTPRAVVAHAPPAPPEHMAMSSGAYQQNQQNQYPPSNTFYNSYQAYGTATPPVAANPYPAPPPSTRAFGGGTYDPEEEARIAEWSSAYAAKDDNKKSAGNANTVALGSRPSAAASGDLGTTPDTVAGASNGADQTKQKTVIREGGGKTWEDTSLLEWDPLHPRLFIGNLAGEVTDDSLLKAFSKYPSVVKARVVRDKRTTKSKSFGFVSFSNTDDYFRAAKDMNGKYIGSHPVLIKKATSEVKASTKRDDKHGKHGRNNKKGGGGANASGAGAGGAFGNNGVHKSFRKNNKNGGPRMLG